MMPIFNTSDISSNFAIKQLVSVLSFLFGCFRCCARRSTRSRGGGRGVSADRLLFADQLELERLQFLDSTVLGSFLDLNGPESSGFLKIRHQVGYCVRAQCHACEIDALAVVSHRVEPHSV